MSHLGLGEAVILLAESDRHAPLVELMAAISVVSTDPTATLDQIMLGLRHRGVVSETAAIALHVRTGRAAEPGTRGLIVDEHDWRAWLAEHAHAVAARTNGH